ncbi:ankyrin [Choiromyces venosus 120613-1]|uniref:Ankyrin n=1 Tax=Choiromyces venosus 120613-1 TaxID=1336337 RepID=A0A3N4IY33_9PEZI|nr:ankyrin [Choiromyces venosus 120613-1]
MAITKLLLDHPDIDVNIEHPGIQEPAVYWAAVSRSFKVFKLLVEDLKVNVNIRTGPGVGLSLLQEAIQKNKKDVVECLLQYPRLDINATDVNGETTLHQVVCSCSLKSPQNLTLLLNHEDLNPNIRTNQGETALYRAVKTGAAHIVYKLLQDKRVDPNIPDLVSNTPLHLASYTQSNGDEIMELILKIEDIDVNAQDGEGMTALHTATARKRDVMMGMLLERRELDVNARDMEGRTALPLAQYGQFPDRVLMLVMDRRTDARVRDRWGRTAMEVAHIRGMPGWHGNVDARVLEGKSPPSRAWTEGPSETL